MLRWFQRSFNDLLEDEYKKIDLYPEELRQRIDAIAVWMSDDLNTGVYKTGFAPDQETYDKNVIPVFGSLNKLEHIVADNGGPHILGQKLTELDIRLYVTLIRFDTVYHQHFKCNLGSIRHDYPVLNNWMKHLYWDVKGFRESTDFRHIKENYTKSHPWVNPKAITPMGPYPDVEEGYEEDLSKVEPGGVKLPAVLEYAKSLKH
jgi:putative glutathione S-transferase